MKAGMSTVSPFMMVDHSRIKTVFLEIINHRFEFGIYFDGLEPCWVTGHKHDNSDGHTFHALLFPYRRIKHVTSVWIRRRILEYKGIPYEMCTMCGEDIATQKSRDPNALGDAMMGKKNEKIWNMCPGCYAYCGWPIEAPYEGNMGAVWTGKAAL